MLRGGGSREILSRGYKLLIIRSISSGDLMHSMVTEANKIVLEIFLRKLILSVLTTHTHKVT